MTANFNQQHKFVVCIDSDGCAMDTMNIKHIHCFGPYAVDVFGIEARARFIQIWDKINLFSQTRGTNRFKGLLFTFQEYGYQQDYSAFAHWVNTTQELSNRSLVQEIEKVGSEDLKLALQWSEKVNTGIKTLRSQDKPFNNVKRSLAIIKQFADIAVVSSANNEAIIDEWTRHELLPYVNVVFGQEEGTKAACIGQLQAVYQSENIVMVGDSPGDLSAAQERAVNFFPILCNHEDDSWDEFVLTALGKLYYQQFDTAYQQQLIEQFNHNLANA